VGLTPKQTPQNKTPQGRAKLALLPEIANESWSLTGNSSLIKEEINMYSECPVCGRVSCDHTPAERGQTWGDIDRLTEKDSEIRHQQEEREKGDIPNKTIRLKVGGWSNHRFARIEGGWVMFEIMCLSCACPMCYSRVDFVKEKLIKSGIPWKMMICAILEREGDINLIVAIKPKKVPEKIDTFLSNLLDLQIKKI